MRELSELLKLQNPDGGWGYRKSGSSWTEPTCYALLAVKSGADGREQEIERAVAWLRLRQNDDGGWRPYDTVSDSTWVTALPLLVPDILDNSRRKRAAAWLVASCGRESGAWHRLRMYLLGVKLDPAQKLTGWPWFPGSAGWVVPTALTVLALEKTLAPGAVGAAPRRIQEGREFLLARRCMDCGWNHGATHALGYESASYPETTGVALLALHGLTDDRIRRSLPAAQQQLSYCRFSEGASWLVLGLSAHGIGTGPVELPVRGETMPLALSVLAHAAQEGRNLLLP